ncbi:hypothetical protein ACIRP7_39620, partial [Streptomyces sp. NPDC102270]|uniref:hypothetical protein n=1 Tax=Streptomyces sp. NPDC102270 TaxID=3366150 RepID=UPI00380CDF5B
RACATAPTRGRPPPTCSSPGRTHSGTTGETGTGASLSRGPRWPRPRPGALAGTGLRDRAYTWTAAAYLLLAGAHAQRDDR